MLKCKTFHFPNQSNEKRNEDVRTQEQYNKKSFYLNKFSIFFLFCIHKIPNKTKKWWIFHFPTEKNWYEDIDIVIRPKPINDN